MEKKEYWLEFIILRTKNKKIGEFDMTESIFAKNFFGVKAYYDLNVVSKSADKKTIVIKSFDGVLKEMKLDEKENVYAVVSESK